MAVAGSRETSACPRPLDCRTHSPRCRLRLPSLALDGEFVGRAVNTPPKGGAINHHRLLGELVNE
jgi:hypothetical protein